MSHWNVSITCTYSGMSQSLPWCCIFNYHFSRVSFDSFSAVPFSGQIGLSQRFPSSKCARKKGKQVVFSKYVFAACSSRRQWHHPKLSVFLPVCLSLSAHARTSKRKAVCTEQVSCCCCCFSSSCSYYPRIIILIIIMCPFPFQYFPSIPFFNR